MLLDIINDNTDTLNSRFVLFGASSVGVAVGYLLHIQDITVNAWFDNDEMKMGMKLWRDVKSEKPFYMGKEYYIIIAVESEAAFHEIEQQCREMGYENFIHIKGIDIQRDVEALSDIHYLEMQWFNFFHYQIDWNNISSFNEKMQWLKLNDRNPLYHVLVDKIRVKEWAGDLIGEEYIIPTIAVWDRFDDIVLDVLPQKFMLKCTHDSGSATAVDKNNLDDWDGLKKTYDRLMDIDYYYYSREWPYKSVERKIIAEEFIGDGEVLPVDYKIMCFHGEPKCLFVCTERDTDRGLKVTFFDLEWNELPFKRHYPKSTKKIARPAKLEEMIELAKKLSKGIPFVRVDFYEVSGAVYFGEMTFYPGAGLEEFTPVEWDYTLGDWIDLDKVLERRETDYLSDDGDGKRSCECEDVNK